MIEEDDDTIYEESEDEEQTCPSCGGTDLLKQGHCMLCLDCGWSLCDL